MVTGGVDKQSLKLHIVVEHFPQVGSRVRVLRNRLHLTD
jgi:hypothetical protein